MDNDSKGAADQPKGFRLSLPLRKRVSRPDWTESGDTTIELPAGDKNYLPALRELVARIVARYGGEASFDKFVTSHLDGLPSDAAVACLLPNSLRLLENAILANDIDVAILATVAIERELAAPYRGFHNATGWKSGRAREKNSALTRRERFEAVEAEIARLRQEKTSLTRTAAIVKAAKKYGRTRNWYYRAKKAVSVTGS